MGKTKNTIKINGHIYDAYTGKPIEGGQLSSPKNGLHKAEGSVMHTQNINSKVVNNQRPIKVEVKSAPQKPHIKKTSHHRAPAAQRNLQHSQTLMRSAVKKPAKDKKPRIKVQADNNKAGTNPKLSVSTKRPISKVDSKRLAHAKHVPKSPVISKFGNAQSTQKPQPQIHASVKKAELQYQIPAAPKQSHQAMFEHAIKHATSHQQKPHKKPITRKQRITAISGLAVLSVVVMGAMLSQSLTGIKFQMASAKAGFDASMPGYEPPGYHLGKLNSSAGVVAMNYKSNSDQDRKFSITQKNSSWDSDTLRNLFVEKNDKDYRVVEEAGLQIYIYGENNATWVNNGIWYVVHGNGSLSDKQLVDIAKSL